MSVGGGPRFQNWVASSCQQFFFKFVSLLLSILESTSACVVRSPKFVVEFRDEYPNEDDGISLQPSNSDVSVSTCLPVCCSAGPLGNRQFIVTQNEILDERTM